MQSDKQVSDKTVSGLRKRMYSPEEILKPWLHALAKPAFSLLKINFTPVNLDGIYSLLPSVELLSTIMISEFIPAVASSIEIRHRSISVFEL